MAIPIEAQNNKLKAIDVQNNCPILGLAVKYDVQNPTATVANKDADHKKIS